jgi:hypothetical protein
MHVSTQGMVTDERVHYNVLVNPRSHQHIASVFIATPHRLPPNWILSLQGWAWHGIAGMGWARLGNAWD